MSIVLTVPFVGCSLADFFGSSDTTKPTNPTVATSTVSATNTPISTTSATSTVSAKSDGVQFAMIASSYGDGTSSYTNNGVDSMFETNYANAKASGVKVGAYHYSYAKTVAAATTEANFFISELKGKQFDYPVCVDIEDPSQSTLDNETLTNISLTYLNMLKQAGYYPMIYANKDWFTNKLDSNALTYDHWLAQWNNTITYSGPVQMWQYSDTGVVKGVSGGVDMDTSYVDYAPLIKSLHVNGY